MEAKPLIAITSGDPCGIGPEVVAKAIATGEPHGACPVVIGSRHAADPPATPCVFRGKRVVLDTPIRSRGVAIQ